MDNKQKLFANLEKMQQLEKKIEDAGITTVKPLVKQFVKLTRLNQALFAMELFKNE